MQTVFRLRMDRQSGESIRAHAWRQQRLNSPLTTVRQHDAFAALLKRQADEITRRDLRAPAFASRWSTELAELHAGLEAIQRQNEALALRNGGCQ